MQRKDSLIGLLFILPQALGFAVFVGGPLIAIFWFSLRDWNVIAGRSDFIGVGNYQQFFESAEAHTVVRNSIVFALGFVPLTVIGGLLMALAVNRRLSGMKLYRVMFFVPVVISLPVWALVWKLALQNDGPVNGVLEMLGFEPKEWLRDQTLALLSVIMVQTFKALGYAMVFFLAALQTVPRELVEAAKVDGASSSRILRSITMPLIAPFTFLVTVLITISSFKSFALVFLLTNGGPGDATRIMSLYIYEEGLKLFDMGYASALAVILFIAVMLLTIAQFLVRRRWIHNEE